MTRDIACDHDTEWSERGWKWPQQCRWIHRMNLCNRSEQKLYRFQAIVHLTHTNQYTHICIPPMLMHRMQKAISILQVFNAWWSSCSTDISTHSSQEYHHVHQLSGSDGWFHSHRRKSHLSHIWYNSMSDHFLTLNDWNFLWFNSLFWTHDLFFKFTHHTSNAKHLANYNVFISHVVAQLSLLVCV